MSRIGSLEGKSSRQRFQHWILAPGVAAMLVMGVTGRGFAMSTCEGAYAATSLQPLPANMVVGIDIHDRSPTNLRLADRFLEGMRGAGIKTGPNPNVLLHVTASVLGGTSGGSSRGSERDYPEMSGLNGGVYGELPPMPNSRLTARSQPPVPTTLYMRVDATEEQETRISWVGSVQCRIVGNDDGARAEALGRVIGASLGKRVDRSAL